MKLYKNKNTMTRLARAVWLGSVMGTALLAASALQAQNTGVTPPEDQSAVPHRVKAFLQDAAQANQTEIAMANIAGARSQNPEVKDLAQMMRTDHQNNYSQLQKLAQAHLVVLDTSLGMMNQHAVNELQKTSDADFDRAYTKDMLKDHVKCIKRFDKAVAEIQIPDVRDYAQNTLPVLRKHLQHSEQAARAVGLDESTIDSILKGLPSDEGNHAVSFNQN